MGPLLVEVRSVLFSVMYLLLHRLVRLLANTSKDLKGDVKVVVLRHQQMVLSATWPSASSPSRPVGYEHPGQVHPLGLQLDEEQHVVRLQQKGLGEEIASQDAGCLGP